MFQLEKDFKKRKMSQKFDHFSGKETWATPKHVECTLAHLLIRKIIIRITYFISTLKSNFKSTNPNIVQEKTWALLRWLREKKARITTLEYTLVFTPAKLNIFISWNSTVWFLIIFSWDIFANLQQETCHVQECSNQYCL